MHRQLTLIQTNDIDGAFVPRLKHHDFGNSTKHEDRCEFARVEKPEL
jgi:hypothetical protein